MADSDDIEMHDETARVTEDGAPLALNYPVYVPGKWPLWLLTNETARLWCEFNEAWQIEVLSDFPRVNHTVCYEMYECSVDVLVDFKRRYHLRDWGKFESAMALGICYRQPFLLEVTVHYSTGNTEYGPEVNSDVTSEVLEVRPLPSEEIARRIEEWRDWGT